LKQAVAGPFFLTGIYFMQLNTAKNNELQLTGRQERILRFIVEQFSETGKPVGSRPLSKLGNEHLSAASIRNTMADLEDLALVTQPHTSAGRIPTDFGYRYYVDKLMQGPAIPLADLHEIQTFFDNYAGMVGTIFESVSKMLCSYSNYIGIVTSPRTSTMVLKHINFIRQAPGKILAIFVSQNGIVQNKLIHIDGDYSQELLEKASRWVTDHFQNLNLQQIRNRVSDMLREEKTRYDLLMQQSLLFSLKSFEGDFGQEGVYVEGTSKLIDELDQADKPSIKEIVDAMEQKSALLDLIGDYLDSKEVQVVIGSEADLQGIRGCSLVAGAYNLPDGSRGNLAVLGPTRMHYPQTIYLVDFISKQISRIGQNSNEQ
jgi:heat-inducible transcriptional repressor